MANGPENLHCRRCGYPLADGTATMGLCPRCLLARVLDIRQNVQAQLDRIHPWPDPPSPESLSAALPQLEVFELLASGGMGLVYRARQRNLDRTVAVKVLPIVAQQDPDAQARFLAEARILAGLNHPHIVRAIEAGQTDQWLYLVMELIDGPNLRDVLKREGRLHPRHALTIAAQVASALAYAHAQQIIHRDVKPENILLDPGTGSGVANLEAFFSTGGRVRLADFGIARPLERSAGDITLTAPHQYVGTADYLAPECRRGGHSPGPASDVYALGVVLYEMLTGHVPAGHFPPPSRVTEVSRRIDAIVLRCLATDPRDRYTNTGNLYHDLVRASAARPHLRTVLAGAAAASVVAAALTSVWVLHQRPGAAPQVNSAGPAPSTASTAEPRVEVPTSQPGERALKPGDAVRIKWGQQWCAGTVVQREGERVLVHYDGWSSNFDEWVGPERLSW